MRKFSDMCVNSSEEPWGPNTDQEFPFPLIAPCGFMLFASDGPDTPTTSHQAPATIQRQTSASPTTQPLTPATPCPWLITGRPPQSIQELFIPNITADKSRSCNCLVHNFIIGPSKTTVKAITVSGKWPLAHQYQALW